ncbi:MAG TPA: hypothetical protein VK430_09855 [Xanthobacteraceae bacterium]|nr:hypothetical protein [Xanthobacteraceae bacterium]
MGMLVEDEWRDTDPIAETGKAGEFQRMDSAFRDRITADGTSGFKAEAGRYHPYVAHGRPLGASNADLSFTQEAQRRPKPSSRATM